MLVEKRRHRFCPLPRPFEVSGMTSAGNARQGRSGNGGRHAIGHDTELGVVLAHHEQHRHVELGQPVPQWFLGPGAKQAEAGGQTVGRVGVPGSAIGSGGVQTGEHGLLQPPFHEVRSALALELAGEKFVVSASGRSLGRVVDPGRRADEHQSPDEIWTVQGQPETEPAAQRIADIHRRPPGLAHDRRRLGEPHAEGAGAAMAGKVDAHDRPVRGQPRHHRVPRSQRLGEPVDQHHPVIGRRTLPDGILDHVMQHPAIVGR